MLIFGEHDTDTKNRNYWHLSIVSQKCGLDTSDRSDMSKRLSLTVKKRSLRITPNAY